MSTSVANVVSHFPNAQNGFTTTTANSVTSGATSVQLNSVAGYINGQPAVFVIDPTDSTKKQTFTGIIDTSGIQVTSVVWTAGTNQVHALGATVVDYATATHISMISKGIRAQHNEDGTHSNITATSVTATNITGTNGTFTTLVVGSQTPSVDWTPIASAPNTIVYNGQRSYTLTFNGVDYTNIINPGTRLRTTRTTAAPNQSTSLNGSTQYYSKSSPAGITFTGNHTLMLWLKPLTAYPSIAAGLISRDNSTSSGSGFEVQMLTTGQIQVFWRNASGASSFTSYQSVPLNRWTSLAVSVTTATPAVAMYLDGISIPAITGSTTATSVVQPTTSLYIGNRTGTASGFFQGSIAQVALFSSALTQATILSYLSQGLLGTESTLISAYSFNNSVNDLNTTNANNLTANGSVVATNADSPFGQQANGLISTTLDYGIVQSTTFSTNTTVVVQVPEGNTFATSTSGVSAISYSSVKVPFGFPSDRGKWTLIAYNVGAIIVAISGINTWIPSTLGITTPVGAWNAGMNINAIFVSTVAGIRDAAFTLSGTTTLPATNAVTGNQPLMGRLLNAGSVTTVGGVVSTSYPIVVSIQDTLLVKGYIFSATGTETYQISHNSIPSHIYLENNLL